MFEKILVPVDGSEASESILALVRAYLQVQPKAKLTLVQVADPYGSVTRPEQAEAIDQAEAYLETVCSTLLKRGCSCDAKALAGDPAEGILAAIESTQPDLVAMSTHGRSGVGRWIRGSVAERILRTTNTPLLMATPSAIDTDRPLSSIDRILVPLDGSALADRILPCVEILATAFDAEVTLLGVRPTSSASVKLPGSWYAEVEEGLQDQKTRLEKVGVKTRVRAARGNAAEEIIRLAAKADLVAMTTHGRSGPSRWWFGSVAEQVIRHSDRPLLVWRPLEQE